MSKLKTLKELERINLGADCKPILDISSEELKAEAVRWIKEYERCGKGYRSRVIFIKHFFNLTEKDME